MIHCLIAGKQRYKGIRDSAWRCLLDFKIGELPVNILEITRKTGIKVIKNTSINELFGDESGVCILKNGKWYVIEQQVYGQFENSIIEKCKM